MTFTRSGKLTPVAQIGETCEGQHEEYRCGRPLGMTFTRSGKLIVCDGVFGLYLVDLDVKDSTEEMRGRIIDNNTPHYVNYEPLLTVKDVLNGSTNLVMNSVVVAEDDDTVYITVSSTNFPLRDSMFEFLSDSSGRLLKLSLKTRQTQHQQTSCHNIRGVHNHHIRSQYVHSHIRDHIHIRAQQQQQQWAGHQQLVQHQQ